MFDIADEIFWSQYVMIVFLLSIAVIGLDEYFSGLKAKKKKQRLAKVYAFPERCARRKIRG